MEAGVCYEPAEALAHLPLWLLRNEQASLDALPQEADVNGAPSGRDEWILWYAVIVLPLALLTAAALVFLWWVA